ncbi:DUF6441 family protein [Sphingobium scionense]|uniref:Uncharacterized protein n=1 Tax=Sphingobium scionense TaxID=1404341 RepID=A0A7W6PVT9_9SPHN|nr:DUF6441 family protein [Sphingobium scionense]MBB4149128.1 hypothetical protein [Sphingobium scionense]
MLDIKVTMPDFAEIERAAIEDLGRDVTAAMAEATDYLKELLRNDVLSAGMGQRLAKTWRSQVYPRNGHSLGPAGFVWSKAPQIVDAFSRGVTIRPVDGEGYLWIPTKNVPPRRRSGSYASSLGKRARGTRMSPEEVELTFNSELIIQKGKRGSLLALIDVVGANNGRGFRQASAGRLKGRKGMAPRAVKRVLMFVLVRQAKMPLRLNLQAAADRAGRYLVSLLS